MVAGGYFDNRIAPADRQRAVRVQAISVAADKEVPYNIIDAVLVARRNSGVFTVARVV